MCEVLVRTVSRDVFIGRADKTATELLASQESFVLMPASSLRVSEDEQKPASLEHLPNGVAVDRSNVVAILDL